MSLVWPVVIKHATLWHSNRPLVCFVDEGALAAGGSHRGSHLAQDLGLALGEASLVNLGPGAIGGYRRKGKLPFDCASKNRPLVRRFRFAGCIYSYKLYTPEFCYVHNTNMGSCILVANLHGE